LVAGIVLADQNAPPPGEQARAQRFGMPPGQKRENEAHRSLRVVPPPYGASAPRGPVRNRRRGGQPARGAGSRAVTSISIFISGVIRPATIIVAAGRTSPKTSRSTGQQGSKSAASGR